MATMVATAKAKKKLVETTQLFDVIDETELDNQLELSWQECLRGEHEDVFEALSEIKEELATGR